MDFALIILLLLYPHQSASTYPLRNSSDLQTLHTNSRLYYKSFLPSAVRDWNELPEQTQNSPSVNIFKNRLNSNLITPPQYYKTAKKTWTNISCYTKNCMQSSLSTHAFKNIVDRPYCLCGASFLKCMPSVHRP